MLSSFKASSSCLGKGGGFLLEGCQCNPAGVHHHQHNIGMIVVRNIIIDKEGFPLNLCCDDISLPILFSPFLINLVILSHLQGAGDLNAMELT